MSVANKEPVFPNSTGGGFEGINFAHALHRACAITPGEGGYITVGLGSKGGAIAHLSQLRNPSTELVVTGLRSLQGTRYPKEISLNIGPSDQGNAEQVQPISLVFFQESDEFHLRSITVGSANINFQNNQSLANKLAEGVLREIWKDLDNSLDTIDKLIANTRNNWLDAIRREEVDQSLAAEVAKKIISNPEMLRGAGIYAASLDPTRKHKKNTPWTLYLGDYDTLFPVRYTPEVVSDLVYYLAHRIPEVVTSAEIKLRSDRLGSNIEVISSGSVNVDVSGLNTGFRILPGHLVYMNSDPEALRRAALMGVHDQFLDSNHNLTVPLLDPNNKRVSGHLIVVGQGSYTP